MNASLIQDTFTYFAKFPAKNGVLRNFTKDSSGLYLGYDTLKSKITSMDPHSLISDLDDYVFGSDVISVIKRVEQISGIYLFVDYGNIYNTLVEPMKTEQGEFIIAVTVARKTQPDDVDQIEQVLLADITLSMISQIKDITKEDSKTSIFLKYLTFPADITPWFARDIFNSTGWTMSFRLKNVHLI